MQILEVVLYNHKGEKRVVKFEPNAVNIIEGGSSTGKSALIEIVDYCLCSNHCRIPVGVILDTVSWFGILLQFNTDRIFIARENPGQDRKTTGRVYIEQRADITSPDSKPVEPNTTKDAVKALLTQKLFISPTLNTPEEGETRKPLTANIRHALFYCFQSQDEIATNKFLFHKQADTLYNISNDIKDTLPYFLGAIREDRLRLTKDLERARRDLNSKIRRLKEAEAIKGEGLNKAIELLSEAYESEILPSGEIPDTLDEIYSILENAVEWTPEKVVLLSEERITGLQEEIYALKKELTERNDAIRAAQTFAQEASGFESEVDQQRLRLESISLFDTETQNENICPLCSHQMKSAIPNAEAILKSLTELKRSLEPITKDRPRLREYIESLENEKGEIRQEIQRIQAEIKGILEEQSSARKLRDLNVLRGKVIGRISLWLESVTLQEETSQLKEEIGIAKNIVEELESKLDSEEMEERLSSILNRIGFQMTEWAKGLQLEHKEYPVRFDLKKLTVVIDTPETSITLQRMGGGENWLSYHLITHFALHKHFISNSRPIPRFLFLDQPSQIYYPSEKAEESKGLLDGLEDEDRRAIHKMYDFIFDFIEKEVSGFQLIITDHAFLSDERFQASVRERWRGGTALIREDWITQKESK